MCFKRKSMDCFKSNYIFNATQFIENLRLDRLWSSVAIGWWCLLGVIVNVWYEGDLGIWREFREFNLCETIINKRNNGRIISMSLNFYESFKILTIIASRKSIIHCKYHNFFRPWFGKLWLCEIVFHKFILFKHKCHMFKTHMKHI